MSISLRRREFITLLGGATAWPLAARAQQGDRVRRIGVLIGFDDDPLVKSIASAYTRALADLGWTVGRNVRMDLRWGDGGDTNRMRALAQELVGLQPDIILTNGGPLAKCGPQGRSLPGCKNFTALQPIERAAVA